MNANEFETWVQDTLDGRLYWDDLMERVIQHRFRSEVYEKHIRFISDESYDNGFEDGVREQQKICDEDWT